MALSCRVFLFLLLAGIIGCGGGGGGGGSAAPAPNPAVTPPLAPSGVATTVMSATSIRVTWVDNAGNEDGFTVEYLISPATTFQTAGTVAANVTQFTHSGLTASTNYTYRVKATNTGGSTTSTNQVNGTTSAAPVTAPAAPSTLTAQAMSSTQINLAWADNSSDEDGFKIERSTTAGSGFTQIDTVGANVVAYSSTGLTASTQYFFRIRAYNSAASPNSAYSNTANATTIAPGAVSWNAQMLPGGTKALVGVWVVNATSIFAVGNNGTILRFDGTSWATQTSPTTKDLRDVWGASSSAIWAVGGDAFTPESTILFFNGTSWATQTSPTTQSLNGVWGSSANNVFAVGDNGTILHFNGTSWATQTSPTTQSLYGIWGSSATNIFAAGSNGITSTILHFNGTSWTTQTSPTTEIIGSVFGTSATNVFIVGNNGVILHFNGTSWTTQTSPVSTSIVLTGIWGAIANDIWVAGRHVITLQSILLHFDGTTWATQTSPTTNALLRVSGISVTDVWLVGGGTQASPTSPAVIFRRQ